MPQANASPPGNGSQAGFERKVLDAEDLWTSRRGGKDREREQRSWLRDHEEQEGLLGSGNDGRQVQMDRLDAEGGLVHDLAEGPGGRSALGRGPGAAVMPHLEGFDGGGAMA
jgi:hypothetical protein